ncbi:MAG TPA: hypothetical protein VGG12_03985 [Methylovirgula sp.]
MKYIVALSLVAFATSPAFAGGGHQSGSLIGSVVAPVTTAVSALNVTALNNVSVLSGNKTNVSAVAPITVTKTGILSGILGSSHGCGCD